jgi:hypothetical protein
MTMDDDDFDPSEYEGDPNEDWTLTAQQQHDVMASRRPVKLRAGSKKRLVKLLKQKDQANQALKSNSVVICNPIESAMANHPGLTREQAIEHSVSLGF